MQWNSLSSLDEVQGLVEQSNTKPQVIFKHSVTCPISSMAKMRIEDKWHTIHADLDFHYLDLIRFRSISSHISESLNVHHESPQIILIKNGEVIYDASHFDITIEELNETLTFHIAK